MAAEITFTPQVLGETEKALNAILYRELDDVGLTEHQWIVLRLTVTAGGGVARDQLVGRLAGALKVEAPEPRHESTSWSAAGCCTRRGAAVSGRDRAGREVQGRVRGAVSEITSGSGATCPRRTSRPRAGPSRDPRARQRSVRHGSTL